MNNQKRLYYKPFRCVGGFLLAIGAIANTLNAFALPMQMAFAPMFLDNEKVFADITTLISGLIMVYAYYLCYRIFFKKYIPNIIEKSNFPKRKILLCILECILLFSIIRIVWYYYFKLLTMLNLYTADMESTPIYFTIIYVVILAPIVEEIVFRGWILNLLKQYGLAVAIIISSFGFGLFHGTLVQVIPAMAIGFAFAYMTIRYNSLIPSIVLHMANNALSTMTFIDEKTLLMPIFSIISIIAILYFMVIYRKEIIQIFKGLPDTFSLSIHSLSLIAFTIMYILIIVITTLIQS